MASLTGCADLLDDGGDAPTDWLYAPSEFGDWRAYGFRYAEPATAFEHAGRLNESSLDRFSEHLFVGAQRKLSIDPADVEWFLHGVDPLLRHPNVTVTRGALDAETLRSGIEGLRSPSFEQAGSYRGYDLYEGGTETAGVDEGTLLWELPVPTVLPLETAVDAAAGRVPRFQERNGAAAAMVERLLPATFASLQVRADGDKRGEGYAQIVAGEQTSVVSVSVFASPDAVPAEAESAETWYPDAARDRVREVEVNVDEEVVVGTGWMPTGEVELGLWPFRLGEG